MKIFSSFVISQLIVIFSIVLSGVILASVISEDIKNEAINRTVNIYQNFIIQNLDVQFYANDFKSMNLEQSQIHFENFFNELKNPEIIGIKVWSNDATVLFSNNDDIIGFKFPENLRYQKSILGETVTTIRDYQVEEKIAIKNVEKIMAIYVPISDGNQNIGVVEAYIDPTFLLDSTNRANSIVFLIIGIMVLVILIVIAINFKINKKTILDPIKNIEKITKNISQGNFKIIENENENENENEITNLINNIHKMSNDLEEYRTKLVKQEKLSTIGELSSRLAHDIRNPLTVIKVTMDIIKTKNKNLTVDEIKKFERIDAAMYRITHQIDNVLDFVKGKPLKLTTQSVEKILVSAIQDLPKHENVIIDTTSTDTEIECDFEAIKIVLINLIVNAIQAIEKEGKITIKSEMKDNQVIIEVKDSGPGIPEEKLEEIFEPLFTTKQEGTGLGLASCKSIINQHGGKISAKNNPTRFIIELPKNIKN
jgi:signal transduction histidine kinase